ncbi:hypothetical protein V6N13_019737 [Hibiscus sabdariffa]
MKSRSSSLMLPTRAPRKDFADTHNIFATLPTRDPQCGFPHFGCEAAHSAFAGTKSAASLFAIGAVLAFVSEALLAQVDSELMVSCNVKKEEEGKSPEGRTNTVVVRIREQLTSFLEDGVGSAFTRDKLFLFLAAYLILGVKSRSSLKQRKGTQKLETSEDELLKLFVRGAEFQLESRPAPKQSELSKKPKAGDLEVELLRNLDKLPNP